MVDKNNINQFIEFKPYLTKIKDELILVVNDHLQRKRELVHLTTGQHNATLMKELSDLEILLDTLKECITKINYAIDLYDLAEELNEIDSHIEEILSNANNAIIIYEQYLFQKQFSNKEDKLNAIITIYAGSGGTEAEDWAGMLFRMYSRWALMNEYDIEDFYMLPSAEANDGFKKIEFIINGKYVYGKLKYENGVHRLIRKSPFDKAFKRHTSFASVTITPEIDDSITVNIDKNDVKIETMRGHGAGGQHRNTTDSAVRMTHLPTGITVFCQNQRSQHRNKELAWSTLYSRVYNYELEKKKQEIDGIIEPKNAFGSQVRSYVLHPTQYIKDHRTGYTEYDFHSVLDGNINRFITECAKIEPVIKKTLYDKVLY